MKNDNIQTVTDYGVMKFPFSKYTFCSVIIFKYTDYLLLLYAKCRYWDRESESEVAQSCNPMDSSLHQAPLSMGFSRQEYWNGYRVK